MTDHDRQAAWTDEGRAGPVGGGETVRALRARGTGRRRDSSMNREELIEEAERGNREREARDQRALFAAAERARLIEKAATAILDANDVHPDDPDGDHGYYAQTWQYAVQDAEAALGVFEQEGATRD
jgi:hypothetical protein